MLFSPNRRQLILRRGAIAVLLASPSARGQSTPVGPAEVTVRAAPRAAEKLRQSAEAVTVVEVRRAKAESADLGEVLARTQGVGVRREAGLGSGARFSLNGLYDEQIRFFLDGVPLASAGYPQGIANVPVNLVERVEIYRGVVPIRFGADALGGAVNLVSAQPVGTHVGTSYQVGSYGVHRVTASQRSHDEQTGLFGTASAYVDAARNDYRVDVQVPNERGRLEDARVKRFHDRYRAYGFTTEVGVLGRSWADRLSLRAFTTGYDKQLQNNATMSLPYGEPTFGERSLGASMRFDKSYGDGLGSELVASYARREIRFVDDGDWVYDWRGARVAARRIPGEINGEPYDTLFRQHDVYARALVAWKASDRQTLRLSVAPSWGQRTGHDFTLADRTVRDPLSVDKRRTTVVSGLEHQLTVFGGRVENIAFVKSYLFSAASEQVGTGRVFRPVSQRGDRLGGGDALRVRVTPALMVKASYEYATRLPSMDELFGNGALVLPNLGLSPEVSHNGNLGPRLELRDTQVGDVVVDANVFWRESEQLVVLLGSERFLSYQNVYAARSRGVEGGLGWTAPRRLVSVDGSVTYLDLRNASSQGTFGDFEGDRIPNRPWLFGSLGARARFVGLPASIDGVVEPFYAGRYVHGFLRGWESVGLSAFKQKIPAQLAHAVGLTYAFRVAPTRFGLTFEVDNATNAALFDSFGAQRPGRSFSLKLSADSFL